MTHRHAFDALDRSLKDILAGIDENAEKKNIWWYDCGARR